MSFKSCVYLEHTRSRPMAITHNDFDIYENWVSAQLVVLLLGHWERVGVEERGKDRRGELRVLEREGGSCVGDLQLHWLMNALQLGPELGWRLNSLLSCSKHSHQSIVTTLYTFLYRTIVLYVDHIIIKQIKLELCIKLDTLIAYEIISLNWNLKISLS